MEIDDEGLDSTDRKLLAAIIQKFASGPVGVQALAAVLAEEVETIEDVYEPFLLRLGFLDRTPQGRIATEAARAHLAKLGYEIPPPRRGEPDMPGLWDGTGRSPPRSRLTGVTGAATFTVEVAPPADGSTRARVGRLTLTHGVVETPQFMPVGTNATVKALHPDDIRDVGASIILANTYHLYLRPGHERIARLGGLHRFMAWDRPDPDRLRRLPGRVARRPAGRRRRRRDVPQPPRRLDPPLHARARDRASRRRWAPTSRWRSTSRCSRRSPRAVVADATERTHRWAERSLAAHTRPDQALFGIVQGGLEPDLRAESTRFIASLPFDGICLGGLAGDETPAQRDADARRRRAAARRRSAAALPDGPRLAGGPARGGRSGRRPVRFGPAGAGRPERPAVGAGRPAEPPERPIPRRSASRSRRTARASLCRSFSRAYLAHLFRAKELLAYRLATCHNLTFTLDFMARIRAALRSGTFPAELPELAARAGREAAVKPRSSPREWPFGSLRPNAEEHRWAREIVPHREAKKKPKDKSGQPKLTSALGAAAQQAELIRKERKPRRVTEEETTDEG